VAKRKAEGRMHTPNAGMRITAPRREMITALAAALYPILPGSARKNGYSLRRIASETKTTEFYKEQGNKQLTIEYYFTGVIRKYPRKPKTIVIKIMKESAIWMANKHRELTPEIRNKVADVMETLGFSIRAELMNIQQPPFEKVSMPADDLRNLFDRLELHRSICGDVKTLFMQGHANNAVRRATEIFEKLVVERSNSPGGFGINLMKKVFDEENPSIKINKLETEDDKKEQKGFKYLCIGTMGCIRNKFSHGDADQIDFLEGFKLLCFLSYMLETVEKEQTDN
jgi:uncharacterized protein (TIGR02391 family)